ncbi:MAG: hypothetical protein QM765_36220 [Myxococcales bacterium]
MVLLEQPEERLAHGARASGGEDGELLVEAVPPGVLEHRRRRELLELVAFGKAHAQRLAQEDRRLAEERVAQAPGVQELRGRAQVLVLVERQRERHAAAEAGGVAEAQVAEVAPGAALEVLARVAGEDLRRLGVLRPGIVRVHRRREQVVGEHRLLHVAAGLAVEAEALAHRTVREAVEGDHEVRHRLVVVRLLGELEEALDQDLVLALPAAAVDVAQQRASHGRPRVGVPGLRQVS